MKLRINRTTIYWICQVAGWGLFGAIGLFFSSSANSGYSASDLLVIQAVITGGMLATSHLIRTIVKRYGWIKLGLVPLLGHLVPLLAGLTIVGLFLIIVVLAGILHLAEWSYYTPVRFAGFALNMFMTYSWWCILYFIIHFFEDRQRQAIEKWKLQAALNAAELTALKSQINPHFIFNSLNNIRALVLEDPHRARDMITHLSELLRYSIQFNNQDRVRLERELEVVQDYLNLESIQLEDRLHYRVAVDPDTLALEIPPMTVQLLVENAIKHGIATQARGGTITVRASRQQHLLEIEVINTGQLQPRGNGTGIGLKNAAERLRLLFGHDIQFSLENQPDNTVAARFRIPVGAPSESKKLEKSTGV